MRKLANISFPLEWEEKDYEVDVRIYYHIEYYGADADGGRGEDRLIIDDVIIKNVVHNGAYLKIAKLSVGLEEAINQRAAERL